jgi:hypothetical protein
MGNPVVYGAANGRKQSSFSDKHSFGLISPQDARAKPIQFRVFCV